jgi:hypothetical protein
MKVSAVTLASDSARELVVRFVILNYGIRLTTTTLLSIKNRSQPSLGHKRKSPASFSDLNTSLNQSLS